MVSRLDAIAPAVRPKMNGRAMLSGPSGAGKTWTGLSMAARLAEDAGRPDSILWIDTERESALTYADVFTFEHLPWRAPYDPTELTTALGELGDRYAVIGCDSFSHFWRGQGGTLEIADSKFGGWKNARPVQERLTDAVLAVPCHIILCVRSKMDYLVTTQANGKQEITKVGLAPIQDETLVYEMNVALDIDLEHRINVVKSRTPAVPVGRMYPAGMERKCADDYSAWLAGGIPPASREEVDSLVASFAEITDKDLRTAIKQEFVQTFGQPHALTADKVVESKAWLAARMDGNTGTDVPPPEPETVPDTPAPDEETVPDETHVDEFEVGDSDPGAGPIDGDPWSTGHGHVNPRPDGAKARCGGPTLCAVCARERRIDGDPESSATDAGLDPVPDTAPVASNAGDGHTDANPGQFAGLTGDGLVDAVIAHVKTMTKATMVAELTSRGITAKVSWTADTLGRMLARRLLDENGTAMTINEIAEHTPAPETAPEPDVTAGTLGV